MRGHRLLLVTITPFSVENASAGKPWRFHSLTSPASERKDTKVKFGDDGISSFCTYTTNKQSNKQKPHPIYIQNSYMNYAEYQSGTNNTNLSFNFEFGVRFSLSTN
jgi:hypothetical protein